MEDFILKDFLDEHPGVPFPDYNTLDSEEMLEVVAKVWRSTRFSAQAGFVFPAEVSFDSVEAFIEDFWRKTRGRRAGMLRKALGTLVTEFVVAHLEECESFVARYDLWADGFDLDALITGLAKRPAPSHVYFHSATGCLPYYIEKIEYAGFCRYFQDIWLGADDAYVFDENYGWYLELGHHDSVAFAKADGRNGDAVEDSCPKS